MFRRTLEGDAIGWYKELPARSIHSFEDKGKIMWSFCHIVTRKTDNGALLNIKQKEAETLRQYVKRFSETMERVVKTEDSALIMAFSVGLKPTCFVVKLLNKKPKTLDDVNKLAYETM